MMPALRTFAARLWRVAAAGLLLVATVLCVAQVFARYVLNDSVVWAEELNRLLFVWLIMIAAAGADHMRIDMVAEMPRFRRAASAFSLAASLLALGIVAWGGWRLGAMFQFDRYVTLDLSKRWYFAAAIVGAAFWAVAIGGRYAAGRPGEGGAQ